MATDPSQRRVSISKPAKRIRWATQRVSSISAKGKRSGIAHRFQKNNGNEKKRESGGSGGSDSLKDSQQGGRDGEGEDGTGDGRRRIFFNVPLPDDAKDEDGQPLARFNRNKIRTARYTPLSFIPKNLWFQFQNIANVYFGFMVILSVGRMQRSSLKGADQRSFFQSLGPLALAWLPLPYFSYCSSRPSKTLSRTGEERVSTPSSTTHPSIN